MAKRPTTTSSPDPIATLGIGLAADHAAEKGKEAENEAADAGSPPDEAKALGDVVEEKVAEATTETPAAPGDEPDAVFQRGIDRMLRAVDEAEFESGTAFGDLRDCMVDLIKHRPKAWHMMSEDDQRTALRAIDAACSSALHKVVVVVASAGADTIHATLTDKFTFAGDSVEAKLKIAHVDKDVLLDIYRLAGKPVVLISADDKAFMAARREAKPDPDQLGMAFADAAPATKPAEPTTASQAEPGPEGDTDLADGADDVFGVWDDDDGEWLAELGIDGGDDVWSDDKGRALRFPKAKAVELAAQYPHEDGKTRFSALNLLGG